MPIEGSLENIFQNAADLKGSERQEYLDQACPKGSQLRKEVEKLLEHLDRPSAFLESPLLETREPSSRDSKPSRLGGYEILRELGRGASGQVFEGQQTRPHRRVALKVLKDQWLDPRSEKRFQREIEILGLLEHPGICRIYEAGKAELYGAKGQALGKRLYFAMELVEGIPITRFAREKNLDLKDRLCLLLAVAEAVAEAHERGVLHRDLKPGNILVTESNTRNPETQGGTARNLARCKVLDFGIGRVLGEESPDQSRLTLEGAVFGTPAYMSPEQFSGTLGCVDTRSDVWALGVLGYELLAGQHPFLGTNDRAFMVRERILGEDPPPLRKKVKGLDHDVETLIQKAMEKDPERRYPTAGSFAEDLRRILRNEPILARPPSLIYQMDRWVKRHKALAAGLGIGVLGLVLGVILSLWSAKVARSERDRALQAQKDAQDINDFFNSELIRVASPSRTQGKIPNVHQLIDEMAKSLEKAFPKRPLVQARIRAALGETWLKLAQMPRSKKQLEKAKSLFQKAGAWDSEEALQNQVNLATWLGWSGQREASLALEQHTLKRARAILGDSHPICLTLLGDIALTLQELGRFSEAKTKLLEIIHIRERLLGKEHVETLIAWNNYALFLNRIGKLKESEAINRKLLKQRTRILGPKHPNRLTSLGNLALNLLAQKRAKEALPFALEALKLRTQVFGKGHPSWLKSCNILVLIYEALSQTKKAKALAQEAYEAALKHQGPKHLDTLRLMNSLSNLCRETGESERALQLATVALKNIKAIKPKGHWVIGIYETTLALALEATGKHTRALRLLEHALHLLEASLGPEHNRSKKTRALLKKLQSHSPQKNPK